MRAFIPEHHGTALIEYFFDRAKRSGATVDPDDFRYPGPRPRSAETAVVMLADATEAALRMLGDPTPERVRQAVEFLLKQRVDAGQLRDCPLTLSDLDRVKEEFVRVITSMHHHRVEYPATAGGLTAALPAGQRLAIWRRPPMVTVGGRRPALPARTVVRAVSEVLRRERRGAVDVGHLPRARRPCAGSTASIWGTTAPPT